MSKILVAYSTAAGSTAEVAEAIADYARAKPKGSRGVHRYSLEDVGIDAAAERERFSFYTRHYGVREETGEPGA